MCSVYFNIHKIDAGYNIHTYMYVDKEYKNTNDVSKQGKRTMKNKECEKDDQGPSKKKRRFVMKPSNQ